METIFSVACAASRVAAQIVVGGLATAVTVFVVGALTKPSCQSFISSFEAFKKLETLESVERTIVTDCVILTVIQSNFKDFTSIVQDDKQGLTTTKIVNKCMLSYGFLNNWTHGALRVSSTTSTSSQEN